jgi:neutral ceramidase
VLRAGAMEVCITPPIGVELAGYGPDLERYASDIHDHLMGQALVLDDGTTKVAVVTSDLLGITTQFTQSVRREVERHTGIPAANILISASHPHTAVSLRPTRGWGGMDRQYVRMVARHLVGAVVAAAGKLQPARVRVGCGEHHWLAWNRTGSGVVDPTVGIVRVDAQDGKVLALLAHYSCHPVILGPKPAISADYPGALRRYLVQRYPGSVILFANGTCGDIDPVTNREVWGQGTFEDVEHAGAQLGEDMYQVASNSVPVDNMHLHVGRGEMQLAYDIPPLETVRDRIKHFAAEARRTKGRDERFEAVTGEVTMPRFWLGYNRALEKRIAGGQHPQYENAELQVIAFDRTLALLAIPAEVYAAQGLAIRHNSPYQYTLSICYANGLYGYLPPREEFETASYTASLAAAVYDQATFRADVAEVMVQAATSLLREMWQQA